MGLTDFIQYLSHRKSGFTRDDPRVASVALAYYLMDADGQRNKYEHKSLIKALSSQYGIDSEALKQLLETADDAYGNSVDIFPFTTIIKQNLNEEERIAFIRFLYDLAYCDGHVYELEDNVIWRIAELIGVNTQNQAQQKKDAASERNLQTKE